MTNTYKNRWYVLSKSGLATLCANRDDAEEVAKRCDWLFTNDVPHIVTHLKPVEPDIDKESKDGK